MAKQVINKGAPPIKWSDIDSAYDQINANFDELYLSLSGSGGAVDLTSLTTPLIPNATAIYDLGSDSKRWRSLYLTGDSLYLGAAHITETGGVVNLPAGSTVGGELLIDPEFGAFRNISVSGQTTVVAETKEDTLTFAAGVGVFITTDAVTDSITFTNVGVTSAIGSNGIGISSSIAGGKGDVTFTNAGVIEAQGGKGISVNNGGRGTVTFVNEGIVGLEAGDGILLSPKDANGFIQVTNSKPAVLANTFSQIAVLGQTTLEADLVADTLTFAKGVGIDITTTGLTDTITIENTGVTSIAVSTGLSSTFSTGGVTLTNTGVTSVIAGTGISVSNATGAVTITSTGYGFSSFAVSGQNPIQADANTDTFVFIAGSGIELITDPDTDSLTISANANISTSIFSEDSSLLVDAINGLIVGDVENAIVTTQILTVGQIDPDPISGEIYLNGTVYGDLQGVVYGTTVGDVTDINDVLLVDGSAGEVVGPVNTSFLRTSEDSIYLGTDAGSDSTSGYTVGIGFQAQKTNPAGYTVAVGSYAGKTNQSQAAVAIGSNAGETDQGNSAVAIGNYAGQTNQHDNSLILNASGAVLNSAGTDRFYVSPIREVTGPQALYYNPTDKEVSWGPVPTGGGGGLGSRTTVNNTTASLADAATDDLTIVGYKGYLLYKIQTSAAAWVRIYTDAASRLADAGRSELTDPTPDSGVIAEVITTGAETILISPGTFGFSNESSPSTNIELAVTNKSGGTTTITVTLTVLQIEA